MKKAMVSQIMEMKISNLTNKKHHYEVIAISIIIRIKDLEAFILMITIQNI